MTTMPAQAAPAETPLVETIGLNVTFPIRGGLFRRATAVGLRAVDDVSLTIKPGEVLGLVGESGSGKTTAGRAIPSGTRPAIGSAWHRPERPMAMVNLAMTPQIIRARGPAGRSRPTHRAPGGPGLGWDLLTLSWPTTACRRGAAWLSTARCWSSLSQCRQGERMVGASATEPD